MADRQAVLLIAITGLSGRSYPEGTRVNVRGGGETVDAFVAGDWLPLSWWQFSVERRAGEAAV